VDEVLRIEHRHIRMLSEESMELTLDYRKTSQFGRMSIHSCTICSGANNLLGIQPFVLHLMPPQMRHLCAVRAYADWVKITRVDKGFVFRKLDKNDRIIETNEAMVRFNPSVIKRANKYTDRRNISRNVSEQSPRYKGPSGTLWHTLVPSWRVSVALRYTSLAPTPDL
jgi:hypothetical protein